MKRIKASFMALTVTITLICLVNYGHVGKETNAYSIDDAVFASGMDLYFNTPDGSTSIPYDHILLDVGVWENHGTVYGEPSITWGRYGKALEFNPDIPQTFYSSTSDGQLYDSNATYATARNNTIGAVNSTATVIGVGQSFLVTFYQILRGYLYFDTSTIGSLTITSATLSLYGDSDDSDTDFNITIQNGQPTYPHDPLVSGDYNRSRYSGSGGTFDTSTFALNDWNDITITELTWINKTSTTKFALRSDREISGDKVPTGLEQVAFVSGDNSIYAPRLTVYFDEDNYVSISDDDSLDLITEATWEFWIYPYDNTSRDIMKKDGGGGGDGFQRSWAIFIDGDAQIQIRLSEGGKNYQTYVSSTTLLNNVWRHVAITFDGSEQELSFYFDGELDITRTTNQSSLKANLQPFEMGKPFWYSYYFAGILDEVRIYPLTLSVNDVKADMYSPINEFETYWFTKACLENNGVDTWYTNEVADRAEYINNDAELPSIKTNSSVDYDYVNLTTVRFVSGFSSYRFYCTLFDNKTGTQTAARFEWAFSLFRNGVLQSTYKIQIRLDQNDATESTWLLTFRYDAVVAGSTQVKQVYIYYKNSSSNEIPVVIDAWVGDDRKHFTMRVTVEDAVFSGDYTFTYAYELRDANDNPRIIDWFDGWVKEELTLRIWAVNNWIEISSHKFWGIAIVLVVTVVIGALGYQYALRPLLQEHLGLALPAIPVLPDRPEDLLSGIGDLAHQLLGGLISLGNGIIAALAPIFDAILNIVNPLIQGFINFLGDIVTALLNLVTSLWDLIVSGTDAILYAIFPALGATAFSSFITAVTDFFVGLFSWIISSFTYLVTMLTSFFGLFTETMGKFLNTLATAITQWVLIFQNIFSMLGGGLGTGINIWESLNLGTWVVIAAIFYPILLLTIWEEKGLDKMIEHLTMIANILFWIFRILITVVQMFITVISSIIESIPIVE